MIASVAPLRRMPTHLLSLSYFVPKELEEIIERGQLVKIPLQNKIDFGIVLNFSLTPAGSVKSLKSIEGVVAQRPLLHDSQLSFLESMANIYGTPLGFLLKSNLLPLKKTKLNKMNDETLFNNENTPKKQSKPRLAVFNTEVEKKQSITQSISSHGQTLILVPELHYIEGVVSTLNSSTHSRTIVITSEISEKNLFDLWVRVWKEKDIIVVGTRRALFLPFFNLDSIVIIDEGNFVYKSWDMAPRFHTRDAATLLAYHHCSNLSFITHTPSVESYYFASKGVYSCNSLTLPSSLPSIVNMVEERKSGNYGTLSEAAVQLLKNNSTGVSFLYLNRRGSYTYVACKDCGETLRCPHCANLLTYYESTQKLICGRCNYFELNRISCRMCGGARTITYGAGTEQLHKETTNIFKTKKRPIILMDANKKNDTSKIDANGTIIIGTQFAWARLPWNKINLIIFVDVDSAFFVPEYKATEELWQNLRLASFYTFNPKDIMVQTSHPSQTIFGSLYKPDLFYAKELEARKFLGYPPFNFLVKFFVSFPNKTLAFEAATKWHAELVRLTKDTSDVTILSPSPSFPAAIKNLFYYIILAKVSYREYKKWTKLLVQKMPPGWKVDPNPNTLLSM